MNRPAPGSRRPVDRRRRRLALILALGALAGSSSAQSFTRAELDALVQPALDSDWVQSLAIGVLEGEHTLVAGYGRLSKTDPRAPDGDTLYETGSISKLFTGILLGDAVARGEVELDDSVNDRLPPGVRLEQHGRPMTLHDLSTHHSGLARMPADYSSEDSSPGYDLEQLWSYLDGHRPPREPGHYEYSNLGTGLLGSLLGHMTGSDYTTLLRERITGPLGMLDTKVLLDDDELGRLAAPHDGSLVPSRRWEAEALSGAGGIHSSIHDMLRFARFACELLPHESATLDQALGLSRLRPRSVGNGPKRIGLGWHFRPQSGIWRHSGQTDGYHSVLEVQPEKQLAVIVFANDSGPLAKELGEHIMVHLLGHDLKPLDVPGADPIDEAQLARFAGHYGAGFYLLEVTLRKGRLHAGLADKPMSRLWPETSHRFRFRALPALLEFAPADEHGVIRQVLLDLDGVKLPLLRLPIPVEANGATSDATPARPWFDPEYLPPTALATDRILLEPLAARHVELDFAALMGSREHLQRSLHWGDWPRSNFTLEENRRDLERHWAEFVAREGYAFTVLTPDRARCVGCLYLQPDDRSDRSSRVAQMAYWVTEDQLGPELDRHLFEEVFRWIEADWPFERVLIPLSVDNARGIELARQLDLEHVSSGSSTHTVYAWTR